MPIISQQKILLQFSAWSLNDELVFKMFIILSTDYLIWFFNLH